MTEQNSFVPLADRNDPRAPEVRELIHKHCLARHRDIFDAWLSGLSLRQAGGHFGISPERVREILLIAQHNAWEREYIKPIKEQEREQRIQLDNDLYASRVERALTMDHFALDEPIDVAFLAYRTRRILKEQGINSLREAIRFDPEILRPWGSISEVEGKSKSRLAQIDGFGRKTFNDLRETILSIVDP